VSIVLIADPDRLGVLRARSEYSSAQAFSDAETPAALEAILTGRPDIVAIERVFAKKSRGAALINRIKANESLETCEIRIVSAESGASKPSSRGGALAASPPPAVGGSSVALTQRSRRSAQRFKIIEGIEVRIDGNPAMLVDLSTTGAQVVSGTLLKPNQPVRLSFIEGATRVRFSAQVAWSALELPKAGPRYRAGIQFFDADAEAVGRLCDSNRVDGGDGTIAKRVERRD